ncbi:MAG: hypothetical protein ACXWV0_06500 [Flavisolibacter sp.]
MEDLSGEGNNNFSFRCPVDWCRPRLKAVPHLNRLQEAFKDRNVVFISITYEERFKTEQIFRKVKFETVVASDSSRTIH